MKALHPSRWRKDAVFVVTPTLEQTLICQDGVQETEVTGTLQIIVKGIVQGTYKVERMLVPGPRNDDGTYTFAGKYWHREELS